MKEKKVNEKDHGTVTQAIHASMFYREEY